VVRARAAEHGLGARELAALLLGPARVTDSLDPGRGSGEPAGAAGLTEKQNTFAKRDAVMAWAAAYGQGAPARGRPSLSIAVLVLVDMRLLFAHAYTEDRTLP
jgi:hypothetical protein